MRKFFLCKFLLFIALYLIYKPIPSAAYSVLTHEAIIDAAWENTIQPLLLEKYPNATKDQLKDAHAYAYGGCVAPDMGYYPLGSKLFTDLAHYVRTGDFVSNMLSEARDLNEYAFAVGVMCHYHADKYGHPIGVNRCVPRAFPEDKEKYGDQVTYEQDPTSHVRIEFGFDVLQTARGNYAPIAYHDFIGFKVSQPVLERAFLKTYGVNLSDVFKDFNRSVGTFRWIVKNLFPTITKAAWASKKAEIRKTDPTITRRKFEYRMRRANYYHEFGRKRERPGVFPTILAAVVKVLPKNGKLKGTKIKIPDAQGEKYFIQSFDTVSVHYKNSVNSLRSRNVSLPNVDYDTGNDTWPGEYDLADKAYIALLLKLQESKFKDVDISLKNNVIGYYSRCNERMAAMAGLDQWQKITVALDQIKALGPAKSANR